MNASPKSRFLEQDQLTKQFLDIVDSEAFQRATELAMLSLMADAATIEAIQGAQKFLDILKALPEKPKPVAPRASHNLQHELK